MSETVLVLPFVVTLLALMFFLGTTMLRLYRASGVDRYEAWRAVAQAPGPATGAYALVGPGRVEIDGVDTATLNDEFFDGGAATITGEIESATSPLLRDTIADHVAALGGPAADNAAQLADLVLDRHPLGLRVAFTTSHQLENDFMAALDSPVTHGHRRSHHEWKYVNHLDYRLLREDWWYAPTPIIHHTDENAELFISDFDEALEQLQNAGNPLASPIRYAYRGVPSYDTPELPPWWWMP